LEDALNWTDRLQQRFGFLAMPGLGRYLVGLQVLCFGVGLVNPRLVDSMLLDPALVRQGELWRLVTFLFLPSLTPLNILFAIFFFMFQWMVFQGLEAEWGAFKLTLYCLIGWLCALAVPMLTYAATGLPLLASGEYWSVSVELAFAYLYPDYTIYLYMILPVKMKWMAWLIGAFLLFQMFTGGPAEALLIAVGLLNYLLFFGRDFVVRARHRAQVREGRLAFTASTREAERTMAPRACSQCGAGPDKDLRLCCCASCGEDGKLWCGNHLPGHLTEIAATSRTPAAVEARKPALQGPVKPKATKVPAKKVRTGSNVKKPQ
jgi:hypothetical protein